MTATDPPAPPAEAARRSVSPVYIILGVLVVVLIVIGFMLANPPVMSMRHASAPLASSAAREDAVREAAGAAREADHARQVAARAEAQAPGAPPGGVPKVEPVDRKIVYTAQLDLVVKNLDAADKQVDELLAANGGRLVSSESRGDAGSKRTATYKLEVPAAKFRAFMAALRPLGVPERDKVDSDDLTDEYVDIQVRVKHLKAEEDNLLKLLTEKARSVEEALAIRRQMLPIREQIERAEGRQKYIEAKAAYSTVTLKLREEANYVPPTVEPPPAPPTFGDRVAKTFAASWGMLVAFGEGLALFGVAIGPWLAVILPVGLVGWWTARRFRRRAPAA